MAKDKLENYLYFICHKKCCLNLEYSYKRTRRLTIVYKNRQET